MKLFLFLLMGMLFLSCTKRNDKGDSPIYFQVEIRAVQNLDCALPEIIFLTNQKEAYEIIGDNKGIYLAYGLPKVNYQPGDKLWVKIRKLESNEAVLCTTFGPSWSEVRITEVK